MLGQAEHSETKEKVVVYVSMDVRPGERLRVRPTTMWEDTVEWPDGNNGPRFKYLGDEIPKEELESRAPKKPL